MNDQQALLRRNKAKNIVILVLSLVVIAQFAVLFSRPSPDAGTGPAGGEEIAAPAKTEAPAASPAPKAEPEAQSAGTAKGEQPGVAGVFLEPGQGRSLLLVFDQPLPGATPGKAAAKAPALITPPVPGAWTWQNKFMARFDATNAFLQGQRYAVTVLPDNLPGAPALAGKLGFDVSWGAFDVTSITASAVTQPYDPSKASIRGTIVFNQPVDPAALMDFMKAADPARPQDDPLPFYFTTSSASKYIDFETNEIPRETTPRDIVISVLPGLSPEEGGAKLASGRSVSVGVVLDPNLRVLKASAENYGDGNAIILETSAPLDASSIPSSISVSPDIAFTALPDGERLLLTGDFIPGDEYLVTLAKGAKGADGSSLPETFESRVFVPDLAPAVNFRDQGMFLSRDGYRNLALTSVNTEAANIMVDRVYRNNLFSLFNFDYSVFNDVFYNDYLNQNLGDRIFSKRLSLPMRLNAKQTTPFDLGGVISSETPGLYRVAAVVPGQWEGFQRWVLITDLGLVAKKGSNEILIFCASLKTLDPQPSATVTVLSYQNQEIAKGLTDGSGLFRARISPADMDKNRPFLITVEKGSDFSFLLFDRFRVETTGLDVGGEILSGAGYAAFMYGERDIYRPGETLEGMAMVRDASLAAPPSMPLTLRQKDPRGKQIYERTVTSDDRGMVPFSLALPDYLVTGPYQLELLAGENVIGEYRFQVEDFVPDRINVKLGSDKTMAMPGETLPVTVTSRYLFGPPASGLDVEARARLVKAPFAPKGFEDYSFGDPERSFEDLDFFEEEGNLSENGELSLDLTLPDGLRPPAALEAVVTARVREGGGRGVTGMVKIPVHAYPSYPGLKNLSRAGVDPGKPVTIAFAAVSPEGKLVPSGETALSFYKDNWQTVLKRTPDGSFNYESVRDPKLLDVKTIKAGTQKSEVAFTPPTYGSYRVVALDKATGASSQVEFYAGGFGYSPWAMDNPARVELAADKESYVAGETARFQVRAPFAGRILATVENGSVKDVQIIDLPGNTGEILVPIKPEYMPNVYVTATLLRKAEDAAPGEPSRAFGAAPIFVDREAGRMPVTIAAPGGMEPLSPLTVEAVVDPGSDVTIAMVDEGILQLIAQKTPDPFGSFYAKRALTVETYDTFALLLPEVAPLMGKALAGGGDGLDLSKFIRSESPAAKTVVYWSGLLHADDSGKVSATFDVPEFMGAVRIMAVAASGNRFGSAEATTRVKSPLSVSPTFPRFLSFDDAPRIPVTVRNDSGADGEFVVSLSATGPATVETPTQTVTLAAGKDALAYFPVRTGEEEGMVSFEVTAEGGGLRARYADQVPVRSPLPARSGVQAGAADKAETVLPDLAASGFLPGSARRDIFIGRQPLIRFAGNLKDLLGYPYGCVEQTVSKAFPLLYFSDLALVLAPRDFAKAPPQAMVQAAIRRLAGMQSYNGGFSMWPGDSDIAQWGSVYATHFLTEASGAGYHVDKQMLTDALRFIQGAVKNPGGYEPEDVKRQCYGLFVLARAGWADIGTMDYLRANLVSQMPSDARALLGAAYAAVGDMRAAGDLLAAKAPPAKGPRQTGGNLDSPLRDAALFLSTLIDAAPRDKRVPKLAEEVGRMLAAQKYPTTQENAFALMALGKYFARQAAKKPFSGSVYAGKTLLASFDSNTTLNLQGIADTGELRIVMDPGYEDGAAFFSVETRGIPAIAGYKPAQNGVSVTRTYLNRDGTPLTAAQVPQGALIVAATTIKSLSGPVDNVVIENLLPAGLEVENPRLETTEKLPWMEKNDLSAAYVDLRDDRVLFFTALPDDEEHTHYALLRAVTPGDYQSPPIQAEAMYAPDIRANGELSRFSVETEK